MVKILQSKATEILDRIVPYIQATLHKHEQPVLYNQRVWDLILFETLAAVQANATYASMLSKYSYETKGSSGLTDDDLHSLAFSGAIKAFKADGRIETPKLPAFQEPSIP